MRRAAKTDATQAAIVDALRRVGVAVEYIKEPVDLLCCDQRGNLYLLEVKNKAGKNQLTKKQAEFLSRWPGQVYLVRTPEEAVRAVLGDEVCS
jgi:hypothetical protein